MKKVYLVKKNPEMPAGRDNWIVMNSYEFMQFMQTAEGRARRHHFGQLDGCDIDDIIIIAECGQETAVKWRAEKDARDYLKEEERKSGITVYSLYDVPTEEEELTGEEVIAAPDCDVEAQVTRKLEHEMLYEVLRELSPFEMKLIENFYLSDHPRTESEFGKAFGMTREEIHWMKRRILSDLRKKLKK